MAKKSTPAAETFELEKAMAELEQLVERMEQGELSLEQSLQDFQRGIELYRNCQSALKEAEQKVQILSASGGQEELVPFESDE